MTYGKNSENLSLGNSVTLLSNILVEPVGLEPTAYRLKVCCTTIVLRFRSYLRILKDSNLRWSLPTAVFKTAAFNHSAKNPL